MNEMAWEQLTIISQIAAVAGGKQVNKPDSHILNMACREKCWKAACTCQAADLLWR